MKYRVYFMFSRTVEATTKEEAINKALQRLQQSAEVTGETTLVDGGIVMSVSEVELCVCGHDMKWHDETGCWSPSVGCRCRKFEGAS